MGWFASGIGAARRRKEPSKQLMHHLQCRICPLDKLKNANPHIPAAGAERPLIYILGEAPGATEDRLKGHFVGDSGQILRAELPSELIPHLRWNNVVRTRPLENRDPDMVAVECFPAGTLVSPIGKVKTLYRRMYKGPMLAILTARGNMLSGTPNHPVFTPRGPVPLQSLKVSDNLLCARAADLLPGFRNPDIDNKPIPIEQIASTFNEPWQNRRVGTSLDFHGDGIADSEVDIIRPASSLGDYFNAGVNVLDQLLEAAFPRADARLRSLMNLSSLDTSLFISPMIATAESLARRMDRVPCPIGFADAPQHNSYFSQPARQDRSADFIAAGQFFEADTGQVFTLDKVQSITWNYEFCDHVYNLETDSGKYTANGVVVSNCCRPSVTADIVASKPKAIFGFGNVALAWATGHSGIMTWRGRRMPVDVGGHECWFYAMQHPASILHEASESRKESLHRVFKSDLSRALGEIEHLPEAEVHDREVAGYGIAFAYGAKDGDLQLVEKQLAWAMQQEEVGFDIETNALRPYAEGAKILSVAFGTNENSFAFALGHAKAQWTASELKRLRQLVDQFLRAKVRKVVHFLRFELEWFAYKYGWDIVYDGTWGGTETQAAVLDERSGAMSLEFLVQQHFGFDLKGLSPLDKNRLDHEPVEDVLWYNAADAKYHFLLWQAQKAVIQQRKFEPLYEEMLARVPSCVLTQLQGIPVNPEIADELANKFQEQADSARADVMDAPQLKTKAFAEEFKGKAFKPLSDDHCVRLFRYVLKRWEGQEKTDDDRLKHQKFKVDEEVLTKIGLPICKDILRLRKATKRLSTYIYRNSDKKLIVWPDGLLHPNFNTVKVRTKRLSCDDPNIQNIPKRSDEGKEVRRQIEAPEGFLFCSADHGQIQARGIAMSSQDKSFCQALWERFDVHGHWAERLAKAYPRRVGNVTNFKDAAGQIALKKFRGDVKNQWTFPLFFGARMERVAEELHIPEHIVEPEYEAFVKMFAGVFQWHEELIRAYNRDGYVADLFGFRHHAPLSKNEIINSPIQSLEALFVMRGMNALSRHACEVGDWHYQPIAQIHDDLTFLLPENNIDVYVKKIVTEMLAVTFPWVNIPMTLEVSIGPNLLEMKECLVASSDNWKP